jgi:hypothetical protein
MKLCEMLFSKILKTDHSLFDDTPCREEVGHKLVLIVAESILANRCIVHGIMARSIDGQLQLHDGGENS